MLRVIFEKPSMVRVALGLLFSLCFIGILWTVPFGLDSLKGEIVPVFAIVNFIIVKFIFLPIVLLDVFVLRSISHKDTVNCFMYSVFMNTIAIATYSLVVPSLISIIGIVLPTNKMFGMIPGMWGGQHTFYSSSIVVPIISWSIAISIALAFTKTKMISMFASMTMKEVLRSDKLKIFLPALLPYLIIIVAMIYNEAYYQMKFGQ